MAQRGVDKLLAKIKESLNEKKYYEGETKLTQIDEINNLINFSSTSTVQNDLFSAIEARKISRISRNFS
jgi:hypothetical protein